MFRIRENADGSTSVYRYDDDKLITVILNPKVLTSCCNVSAVSKRHVAASVGPTIDCIGKDEFLRRINLVGKHKLHQEGAKNLRGEFPLRLISRVDSCRRSETSALRPFNTVLLSDASANSKGKYDRFYRQYNILEPYELPNLRPRKTLHSMTERTTKTVTTKTHKSKKMKNYINTHVYSYGRRQRRERMLTLKTGYDKRSRRLLEFCNKKQLKVNLNRLTEKQIAEATTPRPDCGQSASYPYRLPDESLAPCRVCTPGYQRDGATLAPHLHTVLKSIKSKADGYYVAGTQIKVPFYKEFLESVLNKLPSFSRYTRTQSLWAKVELASSTFPKKVVVVQASIHNVDLKSEEREQNSFYDHSYAKDISQVQSQCIGSSTPKQHEASGPSRNCDDDLSPRSEENNFISNSDSSSEDRENAGGSCTASKTLKSAFAVSNCCVVPEEAVSLITACAPPKEVRSTRPTSVMSVSERCLNRKSNLKQAYQKAGETRNKTELYRYYTKVIRTD